MTFIEMLRARWRDADTLLCVGLDPDPTRFPAHLRAADDAIFEFCRAIVDATADLACAFKPQIAYFASSRWAIENDTPLAEGPLAQGTDSLSGEVRVTTPNGAAESAIKIHPTDANRVIAGTNGPGGGQVMHVSSDGGASWAVAGALPPGGTCCDPTVDWSSDGQYAYAATLGNCFFACNVWFYRSNDGGLTWNGLESTTPGDPRREVAGGADKEYLHVDKHPTSPFRDNLYLTWHESNVMKFARSTDLGNTWSVQTFSSLSGDLGIGSDIVTGPNGTVYYFWPAFNSRTIPSSISSTRPATCHTGSVHGQPLTPGSSRRRKGSTTSRRRWCANAGPR